MNQAYHIGVVQKKETIANGWGNANSIGIEVNGEYRDSNGKRANNEVKDGSWQPLTDAQSQAVACLVSYLMKHFSLKINNVKTHEELCAKTKDEGKTVYDAMLPFIDSHKH